MRLLMTNTTHNAIKILWLPLFFMVFLTACGNTNSEQTTPAKGPHGEIVEAEPEKGPHYGKLLRDGDFTLELSLYEKDVPPEFRVWTTKNGQAINPEEIDLKIHLTRFGNKVEEINFTPLGDALRGDRMIYEPHSFAVEINATHKGTTHTWAFESFEGRTKIKAEVANALAIETSIAGSVAMKEVINVYGKIATNNEQVRHITARFDGEIKSVFISQGSNIRKGQKLATIESNDSLQHFTITSPINGTVSQRDANVGEQTDGRQLFTITDTRTVWAELDVFPSDLAKIKIGAAVIITDTSNGHIATGKVSFIDVTAKTNQSVKVRVVVKNKKGLFRSGNHISGTITVIEHTAALAVKRSGLQPFRDFTVVYKKIGEEYEVRMLELGLHAGEWVEILGGLEPGTHYVSKNSYVIKADIEKAGAAHDH